MFTFIKNLFVSIINFFVALFGGKKSNGGYYMQVEDETPEQQPQVTEAKKPEPAKVETPQPEKAEPVNVTTVAPANQPEPPTAAMNGKAEPQPKDTFAPQYLLPVTTSSRRRPGPSMNMFRDMARQVNTGSNAQAS
ncbi:MAG: hypothetical protein ACOC0N_03090 [Chroococcales cyanobacterium]